jgi:hypothetical protein
MAERDKSNEDPYNVKGMSDKELADALAYEDIITPYNEKTREYEIPFEDLRRAGYPGRIRTRPWRIDWNKEWEERQKASSSPKTSHLRKLYYLSLRSIFEKLKQTRPEVNAAPFSPYNKKIQSRIDKGMSEVFPEGYAEPISPEYLGEYGMHLEPGDTQDFKDAYSGGGYPGPSFVPNINPTVRGQTAPTFKTPKKQRKKKARGGRIKKTYARGGGIRKPKGF